MLQELFNQVDQFGATFVTQTYQALAARLTGQSGGIDFLSLLMTIYVIFWGLSIWWGIAKASVVEQFYRLFRMFVIYTLATSWGDFQTLIYDFTQALPSAIGNSLLVVVSQNATGTAANLNSADQVQGALQALWDSAETSATEFMKSGGITNPGPWFIGAIFLVAFALLVGFGAFLIILAKLFIWLLLALAPVFIVLYLFTQTTSYVEGWVRTIVNFIIVQILTYGALAFFLNIVQNIMDNIAQADFDIKLGHMMTGVLLCIIGVLLLNQIMNVASNISGGGFGLNSGTTIGRFFGRPAGIAARTVGGGARGIGNWWTRARNAEGDLTRRQTRQVRSEYNYNQAADAFRKKLSQPQSNRT
jgi:type IV secretion system protein VirB6